MRGCLFKGGAGLLEHGHELHMAKSILNGGFDFINVILISKCDVHAGLPFQGRRRAPRART